MARALTCDQCESNGALIMLTSLNDGATETFCAGCWQAAVLAMAAVIPDGDTTAPEDGDTAAPEAGDTAATEAGDTAAPEADTDTDGEGVKGE